MPGDYRIEKFRFEHVGMLEETVGKTLMPPTEAVALEQSPYAFTGFHGDRIIGCAGAVKIWRGRYMAWAHVDREMFSKHKLYAVRTIKRYLGLIDGRIEAAIPVGFDEGYRLARAVGMKLELDRAERFFADGQDAAMFVRVN